MYLSTLRSHIEAMGGQLELVARFPDGAVKISNFSDLNKSVAQSAGAASDLDPAILCNVGGGETAI